MEYTGSFSPRIISVYLRTFSFLLYKIPLFCLASPRYLNEKTGACSRRTRAPSATHHVMRMILQRHEINLKHFEAMDTCRQALFCSMSECIDVESIISLQVLLSSIAHGERRRRRRHYSRSHSFNPSEPSYQGQTTPQKEGATLFSLSLSPVSFLDDSRGTVQSFSGMSCSLLSERSLPWKLRQSYRMVGGTSFFINSNRQ